MGLARVSEQRLVPRRDATTAGAPGRSSAPAPQLLDARRGVGAILDTAVDLFLRRFGTYAGFTFLMLLPMQLALQIGNVVLPFEQMLFEEQGDQTLFTMGLVWTAVWLFPWAMARVFVSSLAAADLLGRERGAGRALGELLRGLPGLLLLTFVVSLGFFGGLCACVVPGLFLMWILEPALPAFAVERGLAPGPAGAGRGVLGVDDALRALRRAPGLARGGAGFGRWLGVTLGSLALAAPLLLQFQEGLGLRDAVEARLSPLGTALFFATTVSLFQAIGLAFRSVVVCTTYLDQRARIEGLDLQVALERVAARAPGPDAGRTG